MAKTAEPKPSQFPLCSHNICTVICSVADQFSFSHVPVRQQWVQAFSQVSCCADILHARSFQTLELQGPISCNKVDRLMLGVMLTLKHRSVAAAKTRCLLYISLFTILSGLCVHSLDCVLLYFFTVRLIRYHSLNILCLHLSVSPFVTVMFIFHGEGKCLNHLSWARCWRRQNGNWLYSKLDKKSRNFLPRRTQ